ncbi:MAG: peptidylprolyl isomerase [Betaproteobacteria bacterium]|jgi:FKBP-type peptidyl-prolyl cis-trans isomerase SlpA|nr:peptidylprolyl isomerase [Betaproteobacteria bacterium]
MTAPPLVQPGSFLTLHYRLSGPQGDIINTFDGPAATLTLGNTELSEAIEARLIGLAEGDHVTLSLEPGEAFGPRNPQMLQWVARSLLDKFGDVDASYQMGEVVEFPGPEGQGRYAGAVREVTDDAVLFDFNHPLAGQAVSLEVKVIGVL